MMIPILLLQFALGASTPCVVVEARTVQVQDLTSRFPEMAAYAQDRVVALAPVAGARRYLTRYDLGRQLSLSQPESSRLPDICIERPTALLTAEQILSALREVVGADTKIELGEFSRYPVPPGKLMFPRTGLTATRFTKPDQAVLWRGQIRTEEEHSVPVWVRVRMSVEREELVAVKGLPSGHLITDGDTRLAKMRSFPLFEVEHTDRKDVEGKKLKRRVAKDEPLTASMVESPMEVERGQIVTAEIVNGSVTLKLKAIAEGSARTGETVWLRPANGGKRMKAKVRGTQQAVVNLSEEERETENKSGARGAEPVEP